MKARTSSRKAFSSGVKSRFMAGSRAVVFTPDRRGRDLTREPWPLKDDADVNVSGPRRSARAAGPKNDRNLDLGAADGVALGGQRAHLEPEGQRQRRGAEARARRALRNHPATGQLSVVVQDAAQG